jgi:hypothetical protein
MEPSIVAVFFQTFETDICMFQKIHTQILGVDNVKLF